MEGREEKTLEVRRVILAVAGPVSRLVGTTLWLFGLLPLPITVVARLRCVETVEVSIT